MLTWAKAGCPHDRHGKQAFKFNLAEVEAWLAETSRQTSPGRPPKDGSVSDAQKRAELKLTIERALTAQIKREVLDGTLHAKADCKRRGLAKIHAVKSELLALPRSVASELVGQERDNIEQILDKRVMAMLARFAGTSKEIL